MILKGRYDSVHSVLSKIFSNSSTIAGDTFYSSSLIHTLVHFPLLFGTRQFTNNQSSLASFSHSRHQWPIMDEESAFCLRWNKLYAQMSPGTKNSLFHDHEVMDILRRWLAIIKFLRTSDHHQIICLVPQVAFYVIFCQYRISKMIKFLSQNNNEIKV